MWMCTKCLELRSRAEVQAAGGPSASARDVSKWRCTRCGSTGTFVYEHHVEFAMMANDLVFEAHAAKLRRGDWLQ